MHIHICEVVNPNVYVICYYYNTNLIILKIALVLKTRAYNIFMVFEMFFYLIISRSAFANQGEVCLCTSRLFVHQDIYDEFCKRYVDMVR